MQTDVVLKMLRIDDALVWWEIFDSQTSGPQLPKNAKFNSQS